MTTAWTTASDELPPLDQYVLVWLGDRPWHAPCPLRYAKVMCRRAFSPRDCRAPGWGWRDFGPLKARPDEVRYWAPIDHPDS